MRLELNAAAHGRPLRLIQITDCHLGAPLLGLDTEESLLDVLALIRAEERSPDVVVATGDISGDSDLESYRRFLQLTEQHIKAPVAWLPGNHDNLSLMSQALAGRSMPQQIVSPHWQFILLNSSVDGEDYGELADSELVRLEQLLSHEKSKSALVFLHHQPVAVGSAWVDQYQVRNAVRFFEILQRHPQAKAVAWGHIHQVFSDVKQGLQLLATPSTCVQFKPKSDVFMVDEQMPGYRVFDLSDDGGLATEVRRVAPKKYPIDYGSSGY